MSFFERLRRFVRVRFPADEIAPAPAVSAEGTFGDEACPALYRKAIDSLEQGDAEAAQRMLQEVLAARHDFAEAHLALGHIYHASGRLDDASDCYVLATHFSGDRQLAGLQQGLLALDRGRFHEACGHLKRALVLDPDNATAHNALGAALLKLGDIDSAATQFERAIELQEDLAHAHSNLGYVLFREREQFEAGTQHIERALALAPQDHGVLCNWTMVLQQQGRFDEALALAERLLSDDPTLHEVRLNRALVLLTRGDFARGWHEYEARKQLPPYVHHVAQYPEWDGGALDGKTLLIRSEQGIGDEIMFASCVPDAIRAGCRCVVECSPRLGALFQRSFPAARIIAPGDNSALIGEKIDCEIAAGSLPRYLRGDAADFPSHKGYLVADASSVARWGARLAKLGNGLKVGISWRGGVQTTRRSLRTVPLEEWLPILCGEGACFVSLQYGEVAAELADLGERHGITISHWPEAIDNLDETAALISALDLVITVQTAVAHLSGALGKAAWIMISAVPEWRYMECGDSMPWYPALRLFRRRRGADGWGELILSIAARLRQRLAEPPLEAEGGCATT